SHRRASDKSRPQRARDPALDATKKQTSDGMNTPSESAGGGNPRSRGKYFNTVGIVKSNRLNSDCIYAVSAGWTVTRIVWEPQRSRLWVSEITSAARCLSVFVMAAALL